MKPLDINSINFESHLDKCRMCFVNLSRKKAKITKVMQKNFHMLTGIELHLDPNCSSFICTRCDTKLKETSNYVKSIADIQRKFYKHINLPLKGEPEKIVVKFEGGGGGVEEDSNEEADDPSSSFLFDSRTFLKRFRPKNEESDGGNEAEFDDVPMVDGSDGDESMDVPLEETPKRTLKVESDPPKKGTKRKSTETLESIIAKKKYKRDDDGKPICPECGKKFYANKNLRQHIEAVHINIKRFFCDLCGYGGTIKLHIQIHMRRHIKREKRLIHKCSHCQFISVSKTSLRVHEDNAHGGFIFPCQCGAEFSTKLKLRAHQKRIHEGVRPHVCKDCKKAFFLKTELDQHRKKTHEPTTKNFSCDICGALFCIKKQLDMHRARHDPKFKCTFDGCDKAYVNSRLLQRHLNTHTGNRTELCHLCDKSYFKTRDLQRHLDAVHKQTTFFCEFCDYSNGVKQYLGNHLKSAHNKEKEEISQLLKRVKIVKQNV